MGFEDDVEDLEDEILTEAEPKQDEPVEVEPELEEKPESSDLEEVKETGEKPDRPDENYKREAEKWRQKFHEQQEELKGIKSRVEKIETAPKQEKADPETVEIAVDTFTGEQWIEIEERRGMSKEAIVEIHNTKARQKKLENEIAEMKRNTSRKTVLDGVDEVYRAEVIELLDATGIDYNDGVKIGKIVELVKKAKSADLAKESPKQKKIVSQPEKSTPAKIRQAVKLTEEQKTVARKQGLTEEEYAANL